jgi:hypothetical protein
MRTRLLPVILFLIGTKGIPTFFRSFLQPSQYPKVLGSGSLRRNASNAIDKRESTGNVCGYVNGDAERAREAGPGFECRVDTENSIWGFCPSESLPQQIVGLSEHMWTTTPVQVLAVDAMTVRKGVAKIEGTTRVLIV